MTNPVPVYVSEEVSDDVCDFVAVCECERVCVVSNDSVVDTVRLLECVGSSVVDAERVGVSESVGFCENVSVKLAGPSVAVTVNDIDSEFVVVSDAHVRERRVRVIRCDPVSTVEKERVPDGVSTVCVRSKDLVSENVGESCDLVFVALRVRVSRVPVAVSESVSETVAVANGVSVWLREGVPGEREKEHVPVAVSDAVASAVKVPVCDIVVYRTDKERLPDSVAVPSCVGDPDALCVPLLVSVRGVDIEWVMDWVRVGLMRVGVVVNVSLTELVSDKVSVFVRVLLFRETENDCDSESCPDGVAVWDLGIVAVFVRESVSDNVEVGVSDTVVVLMADAERLEL